MSIQTAAVGQVAQEDATYLKYLPDHLRERYQEGLADAQITHLHRQIALLDVRIKILLETLDRQILTADKIAADLLDEFPEVGSDLAYQIALHVQTYLPDTFIDTRTFRSLDRLVTKHETSMRDRRLIQAAESLGQLFRAIRDGRRDGEIWREIDQVMDSRRKLVEAEERRIVQTQSAMPLDKVVRYIGIVIESLREAVVRYVPDREIQQFILQDAERIYASRLRGDDDPPANAVGMDAIDL